MKIYNPFTKKVEEVTSSIEESECKCDIPVLHDKFGKPFKEENKQECICKYVDCGCEADEMGVPHKILAHGGAIHVDCPVHGGKTLSIPSPDNWEEGFNREFHPGSEYDGEVHASTDKLKAWIRNHTQAVREREREQERNKILGLLYQEYEASGGDPWAAVNYIKKLLEKKK